MTLRPQGIDNIFGFLAVWHVVELEEVGDDGSWVALNLKEAP